MGGDSPPDAARPLAPSPYATPLSRDDRGSCLPGNRHGSMQPPSPDAWLSGSPLLPDASYRYQHHPARGHTAGGAVDQTLRGTNASVSRGETSPHSLQSIQVPSTS